MLSYSALYLGHIVIIFYLKRLRKKEESIMKNLGENVIMNLISLPVASQSVRDYFEDALLHI